MANKNDASLQTTKQMLDELDALMERMLALPVNDADEAMSFPVDVVKTPALSAKLTLLETSASPLPVGPPHMELPIQSPPVSEHAALNPPHLALPSERKPPQPEPLTNEVMPPSLLERLEPLLAKLPEPDGEQVGLSPSWIQPLVWINQVFDSATCLLGGVGGLLRGPAVRMVLGFSGIALLLVAIGWVLKDYLGWNASPWFIE